MEKVVQIITQARVGSTRLPGKILKQVGEKSLLGLHLYRAKKSRYASIFTVATTHEEGVEEIKQIAEQSGCEWYQGSTDDVLDRFYHAAKAHDADYIARLTSDCPLIDPEVIDTVIDFMISQDMDYASNIMVPDFPDGQDVEVFKKSALDQAWEIARDDVAREHPTNFIIRNSDFKGGDMYKAADYKNTHEYGMVRMTVDEPKDFDALITLVEHLGIDAGWREYADFMINHPDLFENQKIVRNAGAIKRNKN